MSKRKVRGKEYTMNAVEILEKLNNGEYDFESEYTTLTKGIFNHFDANDEEVFQELTDEEKYKYSRTPNTRPILNIFKNVYMYISEFNQWVIIYKQNTWNAELS